jgi:TonB family protein
LREKKDIVFTSMELRRNITFSVVLHVLIIAAAFSLNAWDTAGRVPTHSITVSLCEAITDIAALSSQKIARFKPVKENVTEEKIIPQKSPPDRPAEVSAPVEREVINADASVNSESTDSPLTRHSTALWRNYTAQATVKSQTGDNSIQMTEIPSVKNATHSAYALIRDSIEKAKIYPLLARKKKFQGTVLTAFTISNGGRPVNIAIKKSSGHEVLDSEAVQTVRRAAPFPLIDKRIVIPITFTLAGSTSTD